MTNEVTNSSNNDDSELEDVTVEQEDTASRKSKVVALQQESYFSGPLPHPNDLQAYENIETGLADRIVRMAEEQSSQRRHLEKTVVESNTKNEKTGMWLAFVLTVLFMIFGLTLILKDNDVAGWIAMFGPPGFQGMNYIRQKRKEKREVEQKREKTEN